MATETTTKTVWELLEDPPVVLGLAAMSASLHPADLDKETRYELGKLRILHDKWLNATYRYRGMFESVWTDPEVVWHLDALEALLDLTNPDVEP